jgi:hypothetical protein
MFNAQTTVNIWDFGYCAQDCMNYGADCLLLTTWVCRANALQWDDQQHTSYYWATLFIGSFGKCTPLSVVPPIRPRPYDISLVNVDIAPSVESLAERIDN